MKKQYLVLALVSFSLCSCGGNGVSSSASSQVSEQTYTYDNETFTIEGEYANGKVSYLLTNDNGKTLSPISAYFDANHTVQVGAAITLNGTFTIRDGMIHALSGMVSITDAFSVKATFNGTTLVGAKDDYAKFLNLFSDFPPYVIENDGSYTSYTDLKENDALSLTLPWEVAAAIEEGETPTIDLAHSGLYRA